MDTGMIDEFLAEATEALEPDQRVLNQKDGVTVVTKKVPGSEHEMIKAWGLVQAPAHCCYRALCELEERRTWDKNTEEMKILERLDENSCLYYSLVQGIFGMQPRDFLDLRHMVVLPNGTHVIVFVSAESDQCPAKPGVVRGCTILSGQMIKPVDNNSCLLTVVSQVDIKGSIPVYLVNKVAARSPIEWFHSLRVHLSTCERTQPAENVSSDIDYIESKLRRCNRTQLIGVIRSLTEVKPTLVPVIAAGVAAAMAKRTETEYMILYSHEALERFDAVGVDALMASTANATRRSDYAGLVKSANSQTQTILEDIQYVLGQSSTGYRPVELNLLMELNASLRIQVNNYSEAIYTQALLKAAQFEEEFNLKCGLPSTAHSGNRSYGERLSRWWYGDPERTQHRMELPQVNSFSGDPTTASSAMSCLDWNDKTVDTDGDLVISSLASVLAIALQLSKKLELTSVKKLLRLSKYRSFSFEELIQVSNWHIVKAEAQIEKICEQVAEWEAAKHVFALCRSNASLAHRLNDFAEVINKDIKHQSPTLSL
eukprot:TRINITY_DN13217_c0_g1_i22.p1 TRINITY_DN13217_c0_g1~~TRINITY_DN13217_c0_g1_i22.p1  ORF type:complete len:542 (+),score=121.91 TRINITY_DN13217_c0_g1_i22:276-1901(+)